MKQTWNWSMIAIVCFLVGLWCMIAYLFVNIWATIAGVIANAVMALFFFMSKRDRTRQENNEILVMTYCIGSLITYVKCDKFGVIFASSFISAVLMPLLFIGLGYLWYDIKKI